MSDESADRRRVVDIDRFEQEADDIDARPEHDERDERDAFDERDELDEAARAEEDDLDLEASEADPADVAEQHIELLQQRDEPITGRPSVREREADPADVEEQRRVVGLDEEDYR